MADEHHATAVELATELTIAWLSNPNTRISADDVPAFLRTMHGAITELSVGTSGDTGSDAEPAQGYEPAVSVRKSLASKDHLLSLIDGKPYKTLRRHLGKHGLTPEQYRERYNLEPDYPMVSESYSASRRETARKIGLGQKGRIVRGSTAAAPAEKPKRGGRGAAKAD